MSTARVLVEAGANARAKSDGGYTPLMWANLCGHSDIEQYLRSKGATEDAAAAVAAAVRAGAAARQELSPEQRKALDKKLSDAANDGDTAKVLKLIEDGGDIEWQNPDDVSE